MKLHNMLQNTIVKKENNISKVELCYVFKAEGQTKIGITSFTLQYFEEIKKPMFIVYRAQL